MIVDERMVTYINSLERGCTPFLDELEQSARLAGVPIIRQEMKSFLRVLLELKQPKRILGRNITMMLSTDVSRSVRLAAWSHGTISI